MIRVLIVEDDFRVARLHAEVVQVIRGVEIGGVVHTASAALHAAAKSRPDLVLLDLYLPDASGLAVLQRLRSAPSPPDVMVLSAAQDMASVRTAMRYGAVQFLIKPFDLETLRDRVTRYVDLHARRSVDGATDQQGIDDLFAVMRQAAEAGVRLPKGHSAATAQLVLQALTAADDPMSAGELAQRTGISRATAQRYLSTLADAGTVRLRLRYGSTGRPEHRYELVSPHAPRPAG